MRDTRNSYSRKNAKKSGVKELRRVLEFMMYFVSAMVCSKEWTFDVTVNTKGKCNVCHCNMLQAFHGHFL